MIILWNVRRKNMRIDRKNTQERPCEIICNYTDNALGSCLVSFGRTKVICTCSIEYGVPDFKRGSGSGWLTAEYAMLPGATPVRKKRDGIKKDGRSVEIQRLIGRALRQAIDLEKLGEITLTLDCDVIQADGGTRTASITGAYVALTLAIDKMIKDGAIEENPLIGQVAALSSGLVEGEMLVDLCYHEDVKADADINLVMNAKGELIEVQGTGEHMSFSLESLNNIITYTRVAILRLMRIQREALKAAGVSVLPPIQLAVASTNKHKIQELSALLEDKYQLFDLDFLGFHDEIIEDGQSFIENSLIKANAVYQSLGIACIADDSGLCVDALGGKPGIYSARYGGEGLSASEKNALLLKELEGEDNRAAHFSCVISLIGIDPKEKVFEGICRGTILEQECGTNGFGFDPIFCYEDGRPLAKMTESEKNQISHRGNAVRKLDTYLMEV